MLLKHGDVNHFVIDYPTVIGHMEIVNRLFDMNLICNPILTSDPPLERVKHGFRVDTCLCVTGGDSLNKLPKTPNLLAVKIDEL